MRINTRIKGHGAVLIDKQGKAFHVYGKTESGFWIVYDLKGIRHKKTTNEFAEIAGKPPGRWVDMAGLIYAWQDHPEFNPESVPMVRYQFEKAAIIREFNGCHVAKEIMKRAKRRGYGGFIGALPIRRDDEIGNGYFSIDYDEGTNRQIRFENRMFLKEQLPSQQKSLVTKAKRKTKKQFIEDLEPGDSEAIQKSTGLNAGDFWRSVKNGPKNP